jgi:hypothetical protein
VTSAEQGVVAHHVRCFNGWAGMAIKPSDYRTLPIRADEHSRLHAQGEASYWLEAGIDARYEISRRLRDYLLITRDIEIDARRIYLEANGLDAVIEYCENLIETLK